MKIYIGIGTNLGDRKHNLEQAVLGLDRVGLVPEAISSVWETEPLDAPPSPWFWNMTLQLDSDQEPIALLEQLQQIEHAAGRTRGERNAPRPLDLDLLMVGDLQLDDPRLQLPHPRMWARRFVLEPLAEIAPGLRHPRTGLCIDRVNTELGKVPRVRRLGRLADC